MGPLSRLRQATASIPSVTLRLNFRGARHLDSDTATDQQIHGRQVSISLLGFAATTKSGGLYRRQRRPRLDQGALLGATDQRRHFVSIYQGVHIKKPPCFYRYSKFARMSIGLVK